MGWSWIGGPAGEVFDSLQDPHNPILYKTDPSEDPNVTGDVFVFTPPRGWQRIGNPGAMFVVNSIGLYGLTLNKDAIFERRWYAPPARPGWEQRGGAANTIIAGDGDILLYTKQNSGDLYLLPRDEKIGGPGYMFAVSAAGRYGYNIYGVTPEQTQIWRYREPMVWEHLTTGNPLQVSGLDGNGSGTRINSISAGVATLYAVVETVDRRIPVSSKIYLRYEGSEEWTQIGSGQGVVQLAIQCEVPYSESMDVAYSFTPTDGKLRRYTGSTWQVVNPPVSRGALANWDIQRLFSGYGRILVTLADADLWQYSR